MKKGLKIFLFIMSPLVLALVFGLFQMDGVMKFFVYLWIAFLIIGIFLLSSKGYSIRQKEIIKEALKETEKEKNK